MGLFTGPASTSRRPGLSAPLKRRSLGRVRESLSSPSKSAEALRLEGADVEESSKSDTISVESAHHAKPQSSSADVPQETSSGSARASSFPISEILSTRLRPSNDARQDEETEPELDLADLQSDNAFLYQREAPLESALGLVSLQSPEPLLIEHIEEYVAGHYLDCFGITLQDELVRHHDRLVPFFNKAPRFLSIHSLKRKELERDFTEIIDTADSCPRQELCLGRCRLGCSCPIYDLPLVSS